MSTGVGEIVIGCADYYPPRSVNHQLSIMHVLIFFINNAHKTIDDN